jgi:hypothetical protein
MRTSRLMALTLLAVLSATASHRGVLSLIATAPAKIRAGSNVVIQVATTNDSNKIVSYHNTNLCDYSIQVRTSAGTSAPETSSKRQLDCSGGQIKITGRNILVSLKPGESHTENIRVSEMYDMSAIGEYSIQVERTFPGIGHFASNVVKIEVTPEAEKTRTDENDPIFLTEKSSDGRDVSPFFPSVP